MKHSIHQADSRQLPQIGIDCIIPPSVNLENNTRIGDRVVFVGGETRVRAGAIIEPASVIGADITIGQGALIRAGAVVLRSVPSNAVMEGNPAQLVGYRDSMGAATRGETISRDFHAFDGMVAPARMKIGVGECALHLMHNVLDFRGNLSVGELEKDLPFRAARYFLVYDVPSIEIRGEHAHKLCQQFLICVHGSCRVLLDDGDKRSEVVLDRPDKAVYMPPMIWGTQYLYTDDAVLLVFASHSYDPDDYFRTYDAFVEELENEKKQ
ncbi:MAG: isomerase [Planctomycetaceae bacterium]|nr:isomerase [Planctomycetaceae bacterium]